MRELHTPLVPPVSLSVFSLSTPFVWMFARIWIKNGLLCSLQFTSLIRSKHIVPFLESSVPIDFQELNVLQLTVLAVKKEPNKICPKKLLTKMLFNTVIPRSDLGKTYPASNTEESIYCQPPPQALRFSHGRGECETRVTGDESFPPSFARTFSSRERDV